MRFAQPILGNSGVSQPWKPEVEEWRSSAIFVAPIE
jgi:hypothetical protein